MSRLNRNSAFPPLHSSDVHVFLTPSCLLASSTSKFLCSLIDSRRLASVLEHRGDRQKVTRDGSVDDLPTTSQPISVLSSEIASCGALARRPQYSAARTDQRPRSRASQKSNSPIRHGQSGSTKHRAIKLRLPHTTAAMSQTPLSRAPLHESPASRNCTPPRREKKSAFRITTFRNAAWRK